MGKAYIFGHVLQNIGLQRHVNVDCACYPTQFTLAHVQYPVDLLCWLPSNDGAFPDCPSDLLDRRLDLCETEEVRIGILLLIASSFL